MTAKGAWKPVKEASPVPDSPEKSYTERVATHNGDKRAAALEYFADELQDRSVNTEMGELGEQSIHFDGEGKHKVRDNLGKNPLKADLVEDLPDIIRTGKYLGQSIPNVAIRIKRGTRSTASFTSSSRRFAKVARTLRCWLMSVNDLMD